MPLSDDARLPDHVFVRKYVLRKAIALRLSQAPLRKAEVGTSVCRLSEGVLRDLGCNTCAEDVPFVRRHGLFGYSPSFGVFEVTHFSPFAGLRNVASCNQACQSGAARPGSRGVRKRIPLLARWLTRGSLLLAETAPDTAGTPFHAQ